jgi:hypothetical protein
VHIFVSNGSQDPDTPATTAKSLRPSLRGKRGTKRVSECATQAVTGVVMATTTVVVAAAMVTVIGTTSRTASLTWKSLPFAVMQCVN